MAPRHFSYPPGKSKVGSTQQKRYIWAPRGPPERFTGYGYLGFGAEYVWEGTPEVAPL